MCPKSFLGFVLRDVAPMLHGSGLRLLVRVGFPLLRVVLLIRFGFIFDCRAPCLDLDVRVHLAPHVNVSMSLRMISPSASVSTVNWCTPS